MGRMAGWMSVYVVSQWAGNLIVQIVANAASAGLNGYSAYSIAWQLFQLPYAIVGISVITALLPRMSEHASAAGIRWSGTTSRSASGWPRCWWCRPRSISACSRRAQDEARQRPPLLPGPGRLLDRGPAGLGARGARGHLSRPCSAARSPRSCSPTAASTPPRQVHRRGVRPALPRPGPVHADPAAAAGLLLVPGQPDRRLRRPAHHGRQHRGRLRRTVHAAAPGRGGRTGRRVRDRQPGRGDRRLGRCCCGGSAAWTAGPSPAA